MKSLIAISGAILITIAAVFMKIPLIINGVVTEGEIIYSSDNYYYSGYPKIKFQYKNRTIRFDGKMSGDYMKGQKVRIIFRESNPENAYIYSFYSLYSRVFIEYLISIIIWLAFSTSFDLGFLFQYFFRRKKEHD